MIRTVRTRVAAAALSLLAGLAATSSAGIPYMPRSTPLRDILETRIPTTSGKEKAGLAKADAALTAPLPSLDAELKAYTKAAGIFVKLYGANDPDLPTSLLPVFIQLRSDLDRERTFFGDVLAPLSEPKHTSIRNKAFAVVDKALTVSDDTAKSLSARTKALRKALAGMVGAHVKLARRLACRLTAQIDGAEFAPPFTYGEFRVSGTNGDVAMARLSGYVYYTRTKYDTLDFVFENGTFAGEGVYPIAVPGDIIADFVTAGANHAGEETTYAATGGGTIEITKYSAAQRYVAGVFNWTGDGRTVSLGEFAICDSVVKIASGKR